MNYLSIDVGGTFTKFGIIDHSGNFLKRWKKDTPSTLEDFKSLILQEIKQVESSIQGIGMSAPGRIDSTKGYIHTGGALLFLYDFPIKKWLEAYTTLPFAVINDGKAAALAEWWIGNLKGVQNGAAVVLGTGVGGGLILDNHLYSGPHFQAGELSFLLSYSPERENLDSIGRSGSSVLFIKEATQFLGVNENDYEAVFSALQAHSSRGLTHLFEKYCFSIALLISNLQVSLDLEKVVIGGGISEQDLLIQEIQTQYQKLRKDQPLFDQTFIPLEIEACAFRNSSNLLGALYQLLLNIDEENN